MKPSELDYVFNFNQSDCDESDVSNYYSNETLVYVIYSSIVKSLDNCIFSLKQCESSEMPIKEIRRALSLISGLKNALVGSSKTAEQMHHSYSVLESKLQQSFSASDIELLGQIRSTIHEIAESWDLEEELFNSSELTPKVVH
jgi:flagellin-specific chaperone FliS